MFLLYVNVVIGTMQQHYEHGVLKKCPRKTQFNGTNCTNTNEERLAIVFRRGDLKVQYKDTGTPCMSLAPKVKRPLIFGKVAHLEEGNTYSRKELLDLDGTRYVSQKRHSTQKQLVCVPNLKLNRCALLVLFFYADPRKEESAAIKKKAVIR